jgi:peptidoglycan/LPS O-acetylase OafA/YrhL
MPSKIAPLTSLRFFAAAGVVIYHLQSLVGIEPRSAFALGVSFFFVLSGFILTYTYAGRAQFDYLHFFVARFARLWPVHFVTFLIAARLFGGNDTWKVYALNLTLLHAWLPVSSYVFSVNWVSWTISVEAAFYLLFPLIAFALHLRMIFGALAIAAAATLLWLHVSFSPIAMYDMPPFGFSPFHMIQQSPAVRLLEFVAGIVAGRLFLAGQGSKIVRGNATWLEAAGVLGVLGYATTSDQIGIYLLTKGFASLAIWYYQSGGFVLFALMIFVFAHGAGRLSALLSLSPIVLLGEISFCTYMVHQLILRFAKMHQFVGPGDGTLVRVSSLVAAIYLASYLLWRFVERPARSWIMGAVVPPRAAILVA